MTIRHLRYAPQWCLVCVLGSVLFFSGCNAFEVFYEEGSSNDPEVLLEDARFAMQRGDYQKAVSILEKAYARNPQNGQVRVELSGALLEAHEVRVLDIFSIADHLQKQAEEIAGKTTGGGEYCSFSSDADILGLFDFRDFSQYERLVKNWPVFKRVIDLIEPLLPDNIYDVSVDSNFDVDGLFQKIIDAGVADRQKESYIAAFDVRSAVKEQVESLGATWVGMEVEDAETAGGYAKEVTEDFQRREHEHLHRLVGEADVVITTAQIPGRPAPVLITADMVEAMKPGSVIVDLAAESGGNCELTVAGTDTVHEGVRILGPTNLPSSMPYHASQMYSRNVTALLQHLLHEGELRLDMEDEITRGSAVAAGGEVLARS
jgi:hypothetical protein